MPFKGGDQGEGGAPLGHFPTSLYLSSFSYFHSYPPCACRQEASSPCANEISRKLSNSNLIIKYLWEYQLKSKNYRNNPTQSTPLFFFLIFNKQSWWAPLFLARSRGRERGRQAERERKREYLIALRMNNSSTVWASHYSSAWELRPNGEAGVNWFCEIFAIFLVFYMVWCGWWECS